MDVITQDDDDSEPPTMVLQVKYPSAYPEEPPELDILAPHNAPPNPWFSVASDRVPLLEGISDTIEENMGMAMVFTLVSTLKENAEEIVRDRQAAARARQEEKQVAAEMEENKKFHGTPVNPETFLKWRDEFQKEMEELRDAEEEAEEAAEKKKNKGKDTVIHLTGKQLFQRGLVGKIEEDEDDDGLPDFQKLTVEA